MDRSPSASGADRPPGAVGSRDDGPAEVAVALRTSGERLARRKRDRALAHMDDPTPEQAAAADELARTLVDRILAAPTARLEAAEAREDVERTAPWFFDSDGLVDDGQLSNPDDQQSSNRDDEEPSSPDNRQSSIPDDG